MAKKKTYKQLQIENEVLKAQLPCWLHKAHNDLLKCGVDRFMASGLIISVTSLNGEQIVIPFMCADGLEQQTIEALQGQIKKTQALQELSKVRG